MLSFDEIEDCFPEGGSTDNVTGKILVSAQWLHDFAHKIASKEREECANECEYFASKEEIKFSDGAYLQCAQAMRKRSN